MTFSHMWWKNDGPRD